MATASGTIPYLDEVDAAPDALPTPRGAALLAAEWRDLAMLSFEIDPRVLAPFVPIGTELDHWHGATFASVVGFRFLGARLFGVRVPFYSQFPEVNLRFYVRRRVADSWRRGVVFLRELVPQRAVAWTANALGEHFRRVPMTCRLDRTPTEPAQRRIEYSWLTAGRSHRLAMAATDAPPQPPELQSLEEFIVEHYWAYTALPRRRTREAFVVHPPWRIARATGVEFEADVRELYGAQFAPFLSRRPASAFWADGSHVRVYRRASR